MKDLGKYSVEELQEALEKKKKYANFTKEEKRKKLIKSMPKRTGLIGVCEDYMLCVAEGSSFGYREYKMRKIAEAALEEIYGENVWEWVKECVEVVYGEEHK